MEKVNALFKNRWCAIALALLAGFAADHAATAITRTSQAETQKLLRQSPLGRTGTIEFTPLSGKMTQSGLVVLNDREDYTDEMTVCVVYSPAKLPQFPSPKSLIGRKLAVTGKTARYKDRPQLIADSIEIKD